MLPFSRTAFAAVFVACVAAAAEVIKVEVVVVVPPFMPLLIVATKPTKSRYEIVPIFELFVLAR